MDTQCQTMEVYSPSQDRSIPFYHPKQPDSYTTKAYWRDGRDIDVYVYPTHKIDEPVVARKLRCS